MLIAPSWQPRSTFAGTYDEVWQKTRAPYLPQDFNPKFHNSAHPDLVMNGFLKGGESVTIRNMNRGGIIAFHLPIALLDVSFQLDHRKESIAPKIETLLLEPNENRFSLLWRAAFVADKKALKVRETRIDLHQLIIK